jgi:hypothetical protein
MKTNNPLVQIISLLLAFGPIILFWYIDWYYVIGYYNLFFSYTCYILFKMYNNNPNYTRKYHPIIYFGLPLFFNFVGLLFSVVNGFEENKEKDVLFDNENDSDIKESNISLQDETKSIKVENIKINSDLQKVLKEYSKLGLNGFSVDIELKKRSSYESMIIKGSFKGYNYKLSGGITIKNHIITNCFNNRYDSFRSIIEDIEIENLDFIINEIDGDIHIDNDEQFIKEIIWEDGTPESIIKEVREKYRENDFEKLIDETETEIEYDEVTFFKSKNNIHFIKVYVDSSNGEKTYLWKSKESSDYQKEIHVDEISNTNKNLDFSDVRILVSQLKERGSKVKIRSLWENNCDYQLLNDSDEYKQHNKGFFDSEIRSWTEMNFSHSFENTFDSKKTVFSGRILIIEEKTAELNEIIEEINSYIAECENSNGHFGINYDYSFDDFKDWYFGDEYGDVHIGWLSNEFYIVRPEDLMNFSIEQNFYLDLDKYSDIVSFTSSEMSVKNEEHTILFYFSESL